VLESDQEGRTIRSDHGGRQASATVDEQFDFHAALIEMLPRLRQFAFVLTRSRADTDDLVQDAVTNALAAQTSFMPGTNFAAWMNRILRNRFVSLYRRKRETTDLSDISEGLLAGVGGAAHEDRLVLKEVARGLATLPSEQREALIMVVVHGMGYEEIAEATGCAIGTAKSRVFRARNNLHAMLVGEKGQRRGGRPAYGRARRAGVQAECLPQAFD